MMGCAGGAGVLLAVPLLELSDTVWTRVERYGIETDVIKFPSCKDSLFSITSKAVNCQNAAFLEAVFYLTNQKTQNE